MTGKEKEDRLKSLIQKSGADKPSPDFTAIVMQEVMAQEEVAINPALKSLLKRNLVAVPSSDFTRQVMVQIQAHEIKVAQPIISRRAWYSMAAATLLLILYIGFNNQSASGSGKFTPYLDVMGQSVTSFFTTISAISPLYTIVFISLGALVVLDYFLRAKTQNHDKKILS